MDDDSFTGDDEEMIITEEEIDSLNESQNDRSSGLESSRITSLLPPLNGADSPMSFRTKA